MQSVPKTDHKAVPKPDQRGSKGTKQIKGDQGRSKGIKGGHCYLDVGWGCGSVL